MIIGNGDIASVLPSRQDLLFFASGVSNSQETNESEYQRELNLLLTQNRESHVVYFSTLSIFYKSSRYTTHKRVMEELVKRNFNTYTIIRIGNITWGNNPYTFINAYKLKPYDVKNEYRYLVNKEEFLHWINMIPSWSCEINIPGERILATEAIKKYGNA